MSIDPSPVLDPAALERLNRIGGQEFLIEMVELFLEHAPQRLVSANEAFAVGDLETVYRAAHSLKSTAANVGAVRLQTLAAELEERAAAGDVAVAGPMVEELNRRYERVRPELERERDRRKGRGIWVRQEDHDRERD